MLKWLWRLMKAVLVTAFAATVVPVVAGGTGFATLLYGDLPGQLPQKRPEFSSTPTLIFDVSGRQIAELRSFDSTIDVKPEDLPQTLLDAVVASEDRRFWRHNGVDIQGIARAARANYVAGGTAEGGSTITQQYVKNAYLTQDRTVERKLREAVLATQLERRTDKATILFDYLDTIYFGSGAYGIGAAAWTYFRKAPADLNASEIATIVGTIPAPSAFSPHRNMEAAEERRLVVLELMRQQRYLSEEAFLDAAGRKLRPAIPGETAGADTRSTPVSAVPQRTVAAYPFFVDWVEQRLIAEYGPERVHGGGLRVETTITPATQDAAERAVAATLAQRSDPTEDMSLVAVDPATGFVRAMVSGRAYTASQVNLALGGTTGFQPGSSFKTFVLAAAVEAGYTADTKVNAPGSITVPNCDGECTINNYDHRNYGQIPLRTATALSVNTVYADLAINLTPDRVAATANRLGITSVAAQNGGYGVSIALGAVEVSPLDMASAYGTIAAGGRRFAPTPIARILDANGALLVDNTARPSEQALDPNVAAHVTDALTAVVTDGTGKAAALGRPVAGKTGTTENYSNAWFVGFVPQLSTAVWMGHSDGQRPLDGSITGGTLPAQTWATFMTEALTGQPAISFPTPQPLATNTAPPRNGQIAPAPQPDAQPPPVQSFAPGEPDQLLETPS